MRIILAVLALFLGSLVPAFATGSLTCEAEDKSIALAVQAALGGLRRGTVMNFGGTLALKVRTAPADLRKLDLKQEDVTQAWLDSKVFKLEIYRERTESPGAYVLLTIDTRKVDENRYRGRYTLTFDVAGPDNAFGSRPTRVQGDAACGVD